MCSFLEKCWHPPYKTTRALILISAENCSMQRNYVRLTRVTSIGLGATSFSDVDCRDAGVG